MSIRFRKERGAWEVSLWVHGKRVRSQFETKKEAIEFTRDAKLRKIGLSGITKALTIDEAFQEFLSTTSSFKAPRVKRADQRFLDCALHFLTKERGLTTVDQVRVIDLELFMLWIAKPQQVGAFTKQAWSETTVSKSLKLVKAVFRKLSINDELKKDPGAHLNVPRGTSKQRRAMSLQEFKQLMDIAPAWYRPVLLFLRLTGARPSSVAMLTWSDVDLSTASLILRSKKGKLHTIKTVPIPIYPELHQLLAHERNKRPNATPDEFVFMDAKGKPVSAQNISAHGSRLIKAAGLKGVVLYGLRHALAVDMTRAGVSMEIIRQALGHSHISQTSNYAQSIGSDSIRNSFALIRGGKHESDPPPTEEIPVIDESEQRSKSSK